MPAAVRRFGVDVYDHRVELEIKGRVLDIDSTLVMGVVNASPDSFSDAGAYPRLEDQIALAARNIEEGAHIVDVGGQSAITNEPELAAEQELERVVPIIEWLQSTHPQTIVSVDTYKPKVAAAAVAAGASIVNDVSGLLYPELAEICAASGAALVVTHTRAPPKVRLQDPDLYQDVPREVAEFLSARMRVAVGLGLSLRSIVLDPGPDFTKTPHQTVSLLRGLDQVRALGRPLLLALSRKDFIGAILQKPPRERGAGSLAALALLARVPGNIARVHDVAAAVDAVRVVDHLTGCQNLSPESLLPDRLRHDRVRR